MVKRRTGSAHSQWPRGRVAGFHRRFRRAGAGRRRARRVEAELAARAVSKGCLAWRSKGAGGQPFEAGHASLPSVSWSFGSGQISSGTSRGEAHGKPPGGNQRKHVP